MENGLDDKMSTYARAKRKLKYTWSMFWVILNFLFVIVRMKWYAETSKTNTLTYSQIKL